MSLKLKELEQWNLLRKSEKEKAKRKKRKKSKRSLKKRNTK
jgi:hypothetical protein